MAKAAELKERYAPLFATPYVAAQKGYIDDIIKPAGTRFRIIKALEMLAGKRDGNPANATRTSRCEAAGPSQS